MKRKPSKNYKLLHAVAYQGFNWALPSVYNGSMQQTDDKRLCISELSIIVVFISYLIISIINLFTILYYSEYSTYDHMQVLKHFFSLWNRYSQLGYWTDLQLRVLSS